MTKYSDLSDTLLSYSGICATNSPVSVCQTDEGRTPYFVLNALEKLPKDENPTM